MGTHQTTLEDYLSGLGVIEEEFGVGWLERHSKDHRTNALGVIHPIPKAWLETKSAINELNKTGFARARPRMVELASFASDLNIARRLPNYHSEIRSRITKVPDFFKAQYEIYVAALCSRAGYQVEFIKRQPRRRTADIQFKAHDAAILVECKRKSPPASFSTYNRDWVWKNLSNELVLLRHTGAAEHEIFVVAFGPLRESASAEIANKARHIIASKREGIMVDRDFGLYVRRLPTEHWEQRGGVFIPAGQNPAVAEADIYTDDKGIAHPIKPIRVALYTFNSHKFSHILYSVSDARSQLSRNSLGLIYIDLDVSEMRYPDIDAYLRIVSEGLKSRFTPTTNTRIGAIVITSNPIYLETNTDGKHRVTLHRRIETIRNPFGYLPSEFIIPGEPI